MYVAPVLSYSEQNARYIGRAVSYLALAFLGGAFVAPALDDLTFLMPVFLIFGAGLSGVFFVNKKIGLAGLVMVLAISGAWRYWAVVQSVEGNVITEYLDSDIELVGYVASEPDVRPGYAQFVLRAESAKLTSGEYILIDSKILVKTRRYPEYSYGDGLMVRGRLTAAPVLEDFNYKDYLTTRGVSAILSYPKIEAFGAGKHGAFARDFYKAILSFKTGLRISAQKALASPYGEILNAILLGDQSQIDQNLKDELNKSGLRHITAISGMNITIIAQLLFGLGIAIGLWRGQAFYFAAVLIAAYVLMVGLPASGLRAGIMGIVFLFAQKVGRLSDASRSIIITAAFMVAINPLLLTKDVGFQLSFLAIMGLVYLMPFLQNIFNFLPNPKIFPVRYFLSATLAAQIFTLPLLIYNFGQVSLISPLTNLLVLPIIPALTILGLFAAVIGQASLFLSQLLFMPVWLGISYIVKIAGLASSLPAGYFATDNLHPAWVALGYLVLAYFVWKIRKKQRLAFLDR